MGKRSVHDRLNRCLVIPPRQISKCPEIKLMSPGGAMLMCYVVGYTISARVPASWGAPVSIP